MKRRRESHSDLLAVKQKFAAFVVDRRRVIFAVMLVLALICAFLALKLEINEDMTRYLPDKSEMKQGLDLMNEEFPEMQTSQTIRVMFDDLDPAERETVQAKLKAIPYVTGVVHQADSPDYNRDNHTLFVISTDAAYKSREIKSIGKALDRDFSGYKVQWRDDYTGIPDVPLWILASAVLVILLILLLMCDAWVEPFLYLFGIGVAVVINQGTNLILGSISTVTASIGAVLQLGLSMDYSIILSSRYKQEKVKNPDNTEAMKAAVASAFPSIASSGLTTVAGLLMLLFMSFKIGLDLGVAMAKGVFLSMFCVLVLMPGVLLFADNLIRKTARKKSLRIPTKSLARVSNKAHLAITAVFVLLMIGALLLQGRTGIVYTLQKDDPVAEVFPADNTLVLVYENRDEAAVPELSAVLTQDDRVKSVTSYDSMFRAPHTAEELAGMLKEMQPDLALNGDVLSMLYYLRFGGNEPLKMTGQELLTFLSDHVVDNELFADLMSKDQRRMLSQISGSAPMIGMLTGPDPLTPREMAAKFSAFSPDLDEGALELLYLYKAGLEDSDPAWAMNLEELFAFLNETVQNDPRFSQLMGEDEKAALAGAETSLAVGKAQLTGENHSRMIITTAYPDEAPETFRFLEELKAECEARFAGRYYLIGNSAMNLEMSKSFGGEYLFITILTAIVIFLIVALSTRSLVIPLILVLLVQTSVFITVSTIGLWGNDIYFLALLIVQCILMGATIDYGILFTNYYVEYRRTDGILEAVHRSYEGAINTIATSGLILVLVTSIVGRFFGDPTITAIVNTLSLGSFIAILLILICLPGILITFDKPVNRKSRSKTADAKAPTQQ